jgi:FtsP/CotA-like multicopper oxidase with cupredoxin domain
LCHAFSSNPKLVQQGLRAKPYCAAALSPNNTSRQNRRGTARLTADLDQILPRAHSYSGNYETTEELSMNNSISFNRRGFLKYAGLSAIGAAGASKWLRSDAKNQEKNLPSPRFYPDVEFTLKAGIQDLRVLPGLKTRVYKFTARLHKGPPDTLAEMPASYLGPILRLRQGHKVRIFFENQLPEPCIVHWHGLHVPEQADGHPKYGIRGGQRYVYEFEVRNRAGTYFYHSHTHHATAEQAYRGLAGLLVVHDAEEGTLQLPSGEYDIPLILLDPRFDGQNQFLYAGHMHQRMRGSLGDRIMVNGLANLELSVATRPYRLRLINASNSRIYKLGWSDQTPLQVIGTDGGLLERPAQRPYVTLAPGERADVWADFSKYPLGAELTMRSLPFSGVMPMHGMMGGMGRGRMGGEMGHGRMREMDRERMGRGDMGRGMGGPMGMMDSGALPHGSEYPVFKVRVVRVEKLNQSLPARLSTIPKFEAREADNAKTPKLITLGMRHMGWDLNGRSFHLTEAAPEETVKFNSMQLIAFDNGFSRPQGMMQMAHSMHMHGQQFQVLRRDIRTDHRADHATVSGGFLDEGWKDTVLIMPGEKVTLLKRFDHFEGLFLYHCHNLEHEDMDMMRNFLVRK